MRDKNGHKNVDSWATFIRDHFGVNLQKHQIEMIDNLVNKRYKEEVPTKRIENKEICGRKADFIIIDEFSFNEVDKQPDSSKINES